MRAQELQAGTLLFWDTGPALLYIQHKSGAKLDLTPTCSGVFRDLDFYAPKAFHLIGAIITPDEAQQVASEMPFDSLQLSNL